MLIWLACLFVLSGSLITFVAALGVLRLPDFFMRMHAATKAGVVGPSLLLIGAGFFDPSWGTWIKIALAILFLLMTTPIAAHLLGRSGFVGGASLWRGTSRNDLHTVLPASTFVEAYQLGSAEHAPDDMITASNPAEPGSQL